MDKDELKRTDTWQLYQKALDFAGMQNRFFETDQCINFYNGDQWNGLRIKSVEPVSLNFIKPIVKYKVAVVTESARAIKYTADNVDNESHRRKAKELCDLLNVRIDKIMERDKVNSKFKKMAYESAQTGESIGYVYHNFKDNTDCLEKLNRNDIFYADETNDEIQEQPYILIKRRRPVIDVIQMAEDYGLTEGLDLIRGDNITSSEAGPDAKQEFDDKCTVVTKFYKENGTVHFEVATEFVVIKHDTDTGLTLYPLFHYVWEDKIGSARGVGEVKPLIHNQIEVNKTLMRRSLTAKNIAYPQKAYLAKVISNPDALDKVGGKIQVDGDRVDDVNKAFTITKPQAMSPDVAELQNELINTTRELANASSTATGQVNPEDASGKAILAVQKASQQPLNDQVFAFNQMIADYGRIMFDHLKTYYDDGLTLTKVDTNPLDNKESITTKKVTGAELESLQAVVSIEVTPKGAYDQYAQELSLENLANNANFMNTSWLEDLRDLLDNDSVLPKAKIELLINKRKENLKQIQKIERESNLLNGFVSNLLSTNQIIPKSMANYDPTEVETMLNGSE